jgi:hypothetical protein
LMKTTSVTCPTTITHRASLSGLKTPSPKTDYTESIRPIKRFDFIRRQLLSASNKSLRARSFSGNAGVLNPGFVRSSQSSYSGPHSLCTHNFSLFPKYDIIDSTADYGWFPVYYLRPKMYIIFWYGLAGMYLEIKKKSYPAWMKF